jgi:predicted NUDIX family NTP pyrophosphohydrolase
MARPGVKAKRSAGILLYRPGGTGVEVLLVHPGGPFWRNRDAGAWQIPKGEIQPDEDALAAARREAEEELGIPLAGEPVPLANIRQKAGKIVEVFALQHDVDPAALSSNTFELEWPPGSGATSSFPEVDAARWFALTEAEAAMLESQRPLLDALRRLTTPAEPDRRPAP